MRFIFGALLLAQFLCWCAASDASPAAPARLHYARRKAVVVAQTRSVTIEFLVAQLFNQASACL
jgi:hypothetical protein